MRYLVWIVRLVIFIIVLLFATKNTHPVDVGLFAGHIVHSVPLIIVMLIAFALGAVFGLFFAFAAIFRRGRENSKLRKKLAEAEKQLEQQDTEIIITEPVAPL